MIKRTVVIQTIVTAIVEVELDETKLAGYDLFDCAIEEAAAIAEEVGKLVEKAEWDSRVKLEISTDWDHDPQSASVDGETVEAHNVAWLNR